MTKGAHREQSAPPKCQRALLQIALWHFRMILLMPSVFVPDNRVFCGFSAESLDHIQDVSKRSFSILKAIIMPLWDLRYTSTVWCTEWAGCGRSQSCVKGWLWVYIKRKPSLQASMLDSHSEPWKQSVTKQVSWSQLKHIASPGELQNGTCKSKRLFN